MAIELPPLPFEKDALAPHISAETLEYHHGKHHQGYVNKVNAAIEGTPRSEQDLETIIRETHGQTNETKLFNSAAQVFNHTFYWNCLSGNGGGEPSGAIAEAINRSFGSFGDFKSTFSSTAAGVWASGWAWLIKGDGGGVEIVTTSNAGTPITDGKTPLLTADMWEHAYYIDYRNSRAKYLDAFWNLVNWDFVNSSLG